MKLSETEFTKLARSHKTGDDHLKLAEHFAAHAQEHENDAKIHEELAGYYETKEPRLAGKFGIMLGIRVRPPRPCEIWPKSIGSLQSNTRHTLTRSHADS